MGKAALKWMFYLSCWRSQLKEEKKNTECLDWVQTAVKLDFFYSLNEVAYYSVILKDVL
jgi:hypothetical protein